MKTQQMVDEVIDMIDDSGTEWLRVSPPFAVPILLCRDTWPTPIVSIREEVLPGTSVVGLYWKLTGIAKETLRR